MGTGAAGALAPAQRAFGLTFHDAAQALTGSCVLIDADRLRFLFEGGEGCMCQGASRRRRAALDSPPLSCGPGTHGIEQLHLSPCRLTTHPLQAGGV